MSPNQSDRRRPWGGLILAACLLGTLLPAAAAQALTRAEALRILGEQVLRPSSNLELIAAYLSREPLAGGTVTPGFGGDPTVDVASISGTPQWLALVDLEPCGFWAHDALYVFIDDVTGVVTVFAASDWPSVDGVPFGEDEELIRVIPVIPRGEGATPEDVDVPVGDYGDAPDGRLAYTGVPGLFPTKFTSTSGATGAHALTVGLETLGATVSAEQGALDPADPDGVTNLVDTEDERIFLAIDLAQTPAEAHLIYDVSVPAAGPPVPRFVNVVIDFDQNGEWRDGGLGSEWPVQNQPVVVLPGTTSTLITPAFDWGDGSGLPTLVWSRMRLSRAPLDVGAFPTGWDGSGGFDFGEVEDHKIYLRECILGCPLTPPPPPDDDDDGGGDDGGGQDPGPLDDWEGNPVKYFALVVRGRDNPGQNFVRGAANKMAAFLDDQGYDVDTVYDAVDDDEGNPISSLAQIQAWVNGILPQIDCEDRILIYIGAHGADLAGGRVKLGDKTHMTSAQLGPILDKIDDCAGLRCDEMMKSCHVTVLLESCHAGHWRGANGMGGITAAGRTIITSSVAAKPALAIRGDGLYSSLWRQCSADINADGNGDGAVTPAEAHDWVLANNMLPQGPGATKNECDCVCPIGCPPDLDGDRIVGVDDLIFVILNWGTNNPAADVNGDGIVNVDDLLEVILNWGPCPVCRLPGVVEPDPCIQAVFNECQGDEDLECWPVAVIVDEIGPLAFFCTCVEPPDAVGGCAPLLIEDFGLSCLGFCPDPEQPCLVYADGISTGVTTLPTSAFQVGVTYTCDCEEELLRGACCFPDGDCLELFLIDCFESGGIYLGDGSTCTPNPCGETLGACCLEDGTCIAATEQDCLAMGGVYLGDGSGCGAGVCPPIDGACCFPGGLCIIATQVECIGLGGVYVGDFTSCTPNPCIEPEGACCLPDGTCFIATATTCDGDYQGDGSSCVPNPCMEPTGACCVPGTSCFVTTASACDGDYQGNGTDCDPDPCPPPTGACCGLNGQCVVSTQLECEAIDADYLGDGTSCVPNPCPEPTGACCVPGTSCFVTTASACDGDYQGNGTDCNPDPCPPPTGACCGLGGQCSLTTQLECESIDADYLGDGTSCDPNPCQDLGACCLIGGLCVPATPLDCEALDGDYQGAGTTCDPNPCLEPTGACCLPSGSCAITTADTCDGDYQGDGTDCEPSPCVEPEGACCIPDVVGETCLILTAGGCEALVGQYVGDGTTCDPNPCELPGACCLPDGTCFVATATTCDGDYQGDGTTCDPNPCLPPQGACCLIGGTCIISTPAGCQSLVGDYQGDGTICVPNPCEGSGACCLPDGTCVIATATTCDGDYQGNDTSCDPNPCATGACCFPEGDCQIRTALDCLSFGGSYQGDGTVCSPNPCVGACCLGAACFITTAATCDGDYQGDGTDCDPDPCVEPAGACCIPDVVGETCLILTAGGCEALVGQYVGDGTTCDPNPCELPGACCLPDGTCFVATATTCDGDYQGDGTTCDPNPCLPPQGACCRPDGSCVVGPASACDGDYQGDGTTCDPNPCLPPQGACCLPEGGCVIVTEVVCLRLGGGFQGPGTTCDPDPCPPPPGACCLPEGGCDEFLPQDICKTKGGIFFPGVPCSPELCQPQGACCIPGAGCQILDPTSCKANGGFFVGPGVPCDPDPCNTSSCCVSHPEPGCDDPECQQQVCAEDVFCCEMEWDDLCVEAAFALCGDLCNPPPG